MPTRLMRVRGGVRGLGGLFGPLCRRYGSAGARQGPRWRRLGGWARHLENLLRRKTYEAPAPRPTSATRRAEYAADWLRQFQPAAPC